MFKKRNLKGSNFAQDMGALGTSHARPVADKEDDSEPVLQKKVKTSFGAKYSTKEQTEEYEKMATEYTDELKFKARADLITKDSGNAFAHREIDTDEAHDARAIKLKQIQRSKILKQEKLIRKYMRERQVMLSMLKNLRRIFLIQNIQEHLGLLELLQILELQ